MEIILKKILIGALALIIMTGCQFSQKRTDVADTATSNRTCSGYLFGRPTDEQICTWTQEHFEYESNEDFGIYKTERRSRAIPYIYMAYREDDKGNTDLCDSILFWTLSEFMPISECQLSEYARFQLLDLQIQNMLEYDATIAYELYEQHGIEHTLNRARCHEVFRRLLRNVNESVAQMLRKENLQYEAYYEALGECYMTVCGDSLFSTSQVSEILKYHTIQNVDYTHREKLLKALYFKIKDGESYESETHVQIPITLIEKEYDDWLNSLREKNWAYPMEKRRERLLKDKNEFLSWMTILDNISKMLSGETKKVFDNGVNNIRRSKLRMLKTRYGWYVYNTDEYVPDLLPSTCTDDELLEFKLPQRN